MRILFVIMVLILGASAVSAHTEAEIRAEAHNDLMLVARWGMCLIDRVGEGTARGMVLPVVGKVDAAFSAKYGKKATEIAQERFGSEFVKRYYEIARAEHERVPVDKRAGICAGISRRVAALSE